MSDLMVMRSLYHMELFVPFAQIAKENKECNVFATDAILATLMTSPRSAYSWDIIVQVRTELVEF